MTPWTVVWDVQGSLQSLPWGFWIPPAHYSSALLSHWAQLFHLSGSELELHGVEDWQASQVALVVKNLPANVGAGEARVSFLGREDLLERRAWQLTPVFLPWTEEPDGLQSLGVARSQT